VVNVANGGDQGLVVTWTLVRADREPRSGRASAAHADRVVRQELSMSASSGRMVSLSKQCAREFAANGEKLCPSIKRTRGRIAIIVIATLALVATATDPCHVLAAGR